MEWNPYSFAVHTLPGTHPAWAAKQSGESET